MTNDRKSVGEILTHTQFEYLRIMIGVSEQDMPEKIIKKIREHIQESEREIDELRRIENVLATHSP